MPPPDELDLYRPSRRVDRAGIVRVAARVFGILVGLAVSFYGAVLYVLRCFDTCPTDPAEDRVSQLLTGAIVVFGLLLLSVAATAGTRWWGPGLRIVFVLGCAIALCGIVSIALTPSIEAPGDHSGGAKVAVLAIAAGGVSAWAAAVVLRHNSEGPS